MHSKLMAKTFGAILCPQFLMQNYPQQIWHNILPWKLETGCKNFIHRIRGKAQSKGYSKQGHLVHFNFLLLMVEDQSHEYPPGDQQVERVKNSHRILAGRIVFVCFIKQCFLHWRKFYIWFVLCQIQMAQIIWNTAKTKEYEMATIPSWQLQWPSCHHTNIATMHCC